MNTIYLKQEKMIFVERMLVGEGFIIFEVYCEACKNAFRIEVNGDIIQRFSFCPFCGVISELQKGV